MGHEGKVTLGSLVIFSSRQWTYSDLLYPLIEIDCVQRNHCFQEVLGKRGIFINHLSMMLSGGRAKV